MLRKSEAQMLEQLFRCKSDADGRMNLCQFLLLCMEHSLVNARFGFKVFREIFYQASDGKVFNLSFIANATHRNTSIQINSAPLSRSHPLRYIRMINLQTTAY